MFLGRAARRCLDADWSSPPTWCGVSAAALAAAARPAAGPAGAGARSPSRRPLRPGASQALAGTWRGAHATQSDSVASLSRVASLQSLRRLRPRPRLRHRRRPRRRPRVGAAFPPHGYTQTWTPRGSVRLALVALQRAARLLRAAAQTFHPADAVAATPRNVVRSGCTCPEQPPHVSQLSARPR